MSLSEVAREHRRIAILRVLAEAGEYEANASILTDVLDRMGVPATHDQVLGEIDWLDEAGLVTSETVARIVLVRITRRGVEVAQGRATHPGVRRPRPKV